MFVNLTPWPIQVYGYKAPCPYLEWNDEFYLKYGVPEYDKGEKRGRCTYQDGRPTLPCIPGQFEVCPPVCPYLRKSNCTYRNKHRCNPGTYPTICPKFTIPPSGQVARIAEAIDEVYIKEGIKIIVIRAGVKTPKVDTSGNLTDLTRPYEYGIKVLNLPPERSGVLYIVTPIVARYIQAKSEFRKDIVCPMLDCEGNPVPGKLIQYI